MLLEIDLYARLRALTFDGQDDAITKLGVTHGHAQSLAGRAVAGRAAATTRSRCKAAVASTVTAHGP